MKVE
jgi:hypothetical protein